MKVLGKAARGLQKIAEYATPIDSSGAKDAKRMEYPKLGDLLQRYADNKTSPETVKAVASRLIYDDGRLDAQDPALTELAGHRRASDDELKNFKGLKYLRHDLVGLKARNVNTLNPPGGMGPVLTQRFGHMHEDGDGKFSLVQGQTLSSDAIKHDFASRNSFMRQYNANLGSVKEGDNLVFIRSARTDSPKKLEELLLFGASEQKGNAPYRAAIISAMDLSVGKDLATRVHGENEVDLLRAQGRAVDALFGDQDSIKRTLADGREVELKRPVLLNTVLSGQAKQSHNLDAARRYNAPGLTKLGNELAQAWENHPSTSARNLADSLRNATTPAQMMSVLNDPKTLGLAVNLAATHPKEALALTALRVGMTGRDYAGRTYNGPTDPGKELTLMKSLLDVTGRTPSGQCKSGEDRTLTLASMFVTAHQYEAIRGQPYNPRLIDQDPSQKAFARLLFTNAADTFGEDPIKDVRGEDGKAKWGYKGDGDAGHPVPGEMYLGGSASKINQAGHDG